MLEPKVGDKVVIEGVVVRVGPNPNLVKIKTDEELHPFSIFKRRIKRVIASPPQVGDTVWWDFDNHTGCYAPPIGSTLLFIHQEVNDVRKWGVVAFKGDVPKSIPFSKLRKTREPCAD